MRRCSSFVRLTNGRRLATICLSIFVALLCSLGCSDSFLENDTAPNAENTPQLNLEDIRKAFAALSFDTGINDFSLDVLHNKKWDFRLIVPETNAGEKLPLFVNLHGGALTPRPDAHKGTACLIEPALEDLKAYVLSPNSQGDLWSDASNETQVLKLVEFALENLSIDPEKVVVMGYSDGGNGSWFFADFHPEGFSAGIPMASAYGLTKTQDGLVKKIEIPLYVIQGEFDELFPYTNTETWVEQAVDAGSDIILVKALGLTHGEPCAYLPYLKDAITWLQTTVWN
ncbi:MAG: dienelactone hydrolase family protein [Flavobacteriaceae bacterium]